MIEVLVAISLFAVVALALTQSAIFGMRFQLQAQIGNLARNLAVSKAEQLAGVQIGDLNSSYNLTEPNLIVTGHKIAFTRTTSISVNTDGSRTVNIIVSSASSYLPKPVSYTTRFAPWES